MHMDVDGAGPQQTSSSVAAAAGSGRGVLQKVAVAPVQAGMQKAGTIVGALDFFFLFFFLFANYFLCLVRID